MFLAAFVTTIFLILSSANNIWAAEQADFLRRQELVFQLLWSTKESPTRDHPEIFERLKNYKLEDVAAACDNQTYAKKFEAHLRHGLLPRNQAFSPFQEEHAEEVKILHDVFVGAKSFDDFFTLAAWSSLVFNEGSWLHAFATALTRRADSKRLRMPNLYEIYPHYFFNTDVVIQSYRAKTGELAGVSDQYVIDANYTGHLASPDTDDEYKLSYFREDVDLNEFYFHFLNNQPFWLKSADFARGELYYYVHKILLAKYKLERLSLGLGDIEDIDWEQPIVTGFYPTMTHPNGLLFPTRPAHTHVPVFKYKYLEEVKHYETRLSKALDLGELRNTESRQIKLYDSRADDFNNFYNALEGNADSPNPKFFGSLDRIYRRLLGFAPESKKRSTTYSALETSLASLRDPGFYRMCKRIVDYGLKFKSNLDSYKREDLGFDGVRIDYVHQDRLVTYFNTFESALNHPRVLDLNDNNGLKNPSTVRLVNARQWRLDHKPFTLQIGVSSEKPVRTIVRLFLGPRYDSRGNELELEENLDEFYELDRWIAELKQGSNKLERSSSEFVFYAASPMLSDAYNRLLARAIKTSDETLARDLTSKKLRRGLPLRLLLPRGTKSGLSLRLLVCLHSVPAKLEDLSTLFEGLKLDDGRPMGFPIDRAIEAGKFGTLRNFMVKNVYVHHEDIKDVEKE